MKSYEQGYKETRTRMEAEMTGFGFAPLKVGGMACLLDSIYLPDPNWRWPTSENPPCEYVERRIPCHIVSEAQIMIDNFLVLHGYNPESI